MFACVALFKHTHNRFTQVPHTNAYTFLHTRLPVKPSSTGRRRQNWTGHTITDTLPVNLLQPQSHTDAHTHAHTEQTEGEDILFRIIKLDTDCWTSH